MRHLRLILVTMPLFVVAAGLGWPAAPSSTAGTCQGNQATDQTKPIALDLGGGVKLKMVRIKPGKFLMGSPKEEKDRSANELPHEVEITQPFYMGVYTVTQSQYRQVMGKNPSYFSAQGDGKDKVAGMNTDDFPVEDVSWLDAKKFCDKVSALPELRARGWRVDLPTEAEWEYACRAGTKTSFSFGNSLSSQQANIQGPKTTRVGSYAPNVWGLYDMHGNVFQWCKDWYGEYQNNEPKDPQGAKNGTGRILRGGSWNLGAVFARAARRDYNTPTTNNSFDHNGFRVVVRLPSRTP